jgi:hypothetical protein
MTLCAGRAQRLKRRELVTMLMELKAIIGWRWRPKGKKRPMASGIPSTSADPSA